MDKLKVVLKSMYNIDWDNLEVELIVQKGDQLYYDGISEKLNQKNINTTNQIRDNLSFI